MRSYISLLVTAIGLCLMAHQGSAGVCEKETFFGQTQYFNCPQPGDDRDAQFCCGTKDNRYCCNSPFGVDDEVLKQFTDKEPEALAQVQETPVVPKTANDQEGLRDTVNRVKVKVNGTIHAGKDKVKQKVKDKVEEKAVKKLDPTGTFKSLPVILGVMGAIILGLIVLCIVCCCCCPFCLLHKRRNRGAVHNPVPADVTVTQPLQPMQPYPGQQPYPPQGYPPQQGYPAQQPYMPQQQQPYPPQGYPSNPGYPPQPYPPQGNPAVYPDLTEK